MPFLSELKTNLKSLKFGRDVYRNGNSGLPYIQTQIPGEPTSPGTSRSLWPTLQNGNLDLPIRGGEASFSLAVQTFTRSSQLDYERIRKFMEDPTRGPAFIRTQVGLQLSNPKIETAAGSAFGTSDVPGPIENTRVYNLGKNTLAQVKASGTGAHGTRHGLVPFSLAQKNYYYTVNQQNITGGEEGSYQNRLVLLKEMKMNPNDQNGFVSSFSTNVDINKVNKLGISLNRNILFQYLGGPGSVYGIGSTTIYRREDTSRLASDNVIYKDGLPPVNYLDLTTNLNTSRLGENTLNPGREEIVNRLLELRKIKILGETLPENVPGQPDVNPFRISNEENELLKYDNGPGTIDKDPKTGKITVGKTKTVIKKPESTIRIKSRFTMAYDQLAEQSPNESTYDSVNEAGLITGRKRNIQDFRANENISSSLANEGFLPMGTWNETDTIDYKFFVKDKNYVDKMNLLNPIVSNNNTNNPWTTNIPDNASSEDLIKFVFECVSNDNSGATNLFFRAFLNGSITDNHGASWSAFKYMGRGEDFYTYQGFTRAISFAFRVYAGSEEEMIPMYNKVNTLVSQVYPDYSAGGIMRAPIVKITIGDYLYRMPGLLDSVNLSIENNAIWETKDGLQLPHRMDVSISFKPVPNYLPRRAKSSDVPALIANRQGIISTSY